MLFCDQGLQSRRDTAVVLHPQERNLRH